MVGANSLIATVMLGLEGLTSSSAGKKLGCGWGRPHLVWRASLLQSQCSTVLGPYEQDEKTGPQTTLTAPLTFKMLTAAILVGHPLFLM